MGLLNLRSIIEFDQQELTESNILTHEGIIFGGDDYTASIGMAVLVVVVVVLVPTHTHTHTHTPTHTHTARTGAVRSPSNKELLYARQVLHFDSTTSHPLIYIDPL